MLKVVDKTVFPNSKNADNSAVCLNALVLFPSECHFILNVSVPLFPFSPAHRFESPSISTHLCVKLIRLKVILNILNESW